MAGNAVDECYAEKSYKIDIDPNDVAQVLDAQGLIAYQPERMLRTRIGAHPYTI